MKLIAVMAVVLLFGSLAAETITVNSVTNTVIVPSQITMGYNGILSLTVSFDTGNGLVSNAFTVNSPPIAQATAYSKSVTPSASLQSISATLNNATFSVTVNALPKANRNVTLADGTCQTLNSTYNIIACSQKSMWNYTHTYNLTSNSSLSISNTLFGVNILVNVKPQALCGINKTITPTIGLVTQFSNLSSPCHVIFTINDTQKANIYNTLLPGQGVSNSILGIAVNVPPMNQIIWNFTALQILYQQKFASVCNHLYTPSGARYAVCLDNLSALAIGDILNTKNLSEGIGTALLHIQSSSTQQYQQLQLSYNSLNTTYQGVYTWNKTNTKIIGTLESGNESQGWQIGGFFGIVGFGAALWAYLKNRQHSARRVWNLK